MPTTYFEWDLISDNLIGEYDENGNVLAEYTHEPSLHGRLKCENRSGQPYYRHYDAQGNTIALTNDQGQLVDAFAYTSNGESTERTGMTPTPFRFGGEYGYFTDLETGELIVRRRTLDPSHGRWLSIEPIVELVAGDHYLYASNNPVIHLDPSGELSYENVNEVQVPGMDKSHFHLGACGQYAWTIKWVLSDKEKRFENGFIVQQVVLTWSVRDCDNKRVPLRHTCVVHNIGRTDVPVYQVVYYEIWRVHNGELYVDVLNDPPTKKAEPYHDTFSGEKADKTYGCHSKRGEAFFVKDLRGLTQLREGRVAEAGILFARCQLPRGLSWAELRRNAVDKTATRVAQVEWDCCPPERDPKCYYGPPDPRNAKEDEKKELQNACNR